MKKLFVMTGEYSGDIHAAHVISELKKIYPDVEIEAIGGENLKNQGVKLFADHSKMSAVGISPLILWNHYKLGKNVVKYLTEEYRPDLVLCIDYGAFNLNVAKFLKRAGIKVFYYIPPQIWASRKWRIKTVKKYVDKVLCIFPFEKPMYEFYKIPAYYCGHPLVSQLAPKADRIEFFKKHGFDVNKKLVSVFPGSRTFELKELMNIFIKSAKKLKKNHPDLQFCVSQAPNLKDEVYHKYLKNSDFKVIKGENQALLSCSDALILASGTVALEACLYQVPMIIAYRGPYILYLIYLLVRCIKRVSLPNIIADRSIVPELIQSRVTVDNIVYQTEKNLFNTSYREDFIRQLEEVKYLMSDKNAPLEAAKQIAEEFLNNS